MSIEQEFADNLVQYKHIIYKVCFMYADNKDDVNDLYQESVFNIWKSYKNFRGRKFVRNMGLPHIPKHMYLRFPKKEEIRLCPLGAASRYSGRL